MIDDTLLEAEEKMDKAIGVAKEDFAGIRTGRATAKMFDKITAEYYGTQTPVTQMATFGIPKAIRDSDLGVNPSNDGVVIRVAFPQLTEDRRKEYIKVARHKAEEARVSVRNIRRHAKDTLDKMAKNGDVGEDDARRAEKHLDDATHKYVTQIDEMLKHKEGELLEV